MTAFVRQLAACSITRRGAWFMACGLSLGTLGCETERDDDSPSDAGRPSVSRTARDGPVLLTLRVTPAEIDLSEHAQVRVYVSGKPGVPVERNDDRDVFSVF